MTGVAQSNVSVLEKTLLEVSECCPDGLSFPEVWAAKSFCILRTIPHLKNLLKYNLFFLKLELIFMTYNQRELVHSLYLCYNFQAYQVKIIFAFKPGMN